MPSLEALLVAAPVLIVGVAIGIWLAALLTVGEEEDAWLREQRERELRARVVDAHRHIESLKSANRVLLERLKEATAR